MTLKVIGAGLGRTGTMSLKLALEALGLGPCYHMVEVFPRPTAPGLWLDACEGRPVDWEVVFEGFVSTVDWPSAAFYAELADRYPDAKVILTTRDPEAWFASTQATIFADPEFTKAPPPFRAMIKAMLARHYDSRVEDHDHLVARFNAHNEAVRRTIPAARLLEFEASQGWEPLCAFLGVPVPDAPYPAVNSTDEFRTNMAARVAAAQTGAAA